MENNRKLVELVSSAKMDVADMKDVQTVTFKDHWFGKNDIAISEDGNCELHIGFRIAENVYAIFSEVGKIKIGTKFRLKLTN